MFNKILVANRGEIAVRLIRAVQDMGAHAVVVYSDDDADALPVRLADQAVSLAVGAQAAIGPRAYLDAARIIDIALANGCQAVHPGYGFLSEQAAFAQACADAGLTFVGPAPEQLHTFGDKAAARALAERCQVPLLPGLNHAMSLDEAHAFFAQHEASGIVIKAVGGGGGRGMRVVSQSSEVAPAYERCRAEAQAAFGGADVYAERLMRLARHVEVQVIGDGRAVAVLGDRECSLQRRFQKLVEVAPSPSISAKVRDALFAAARRMAEAVNYRGLGTFEFLVDGDPASSCPWVFIEANARLQVEHTITEAVTGLDLVQMQIAVAAGSTLANLNLPTSQPVMPYGHAIQWRINAETLGADGQPRPSHGAPQRLHWPSGPGLRVDTYAQAGVAPSPHHDSLLAKLIVHATGGFDQVVRRSQRALAEVGIDGLATNLPLLRAIAADPNWTSQRVHTRYVEEHLSELLAAASHFESNAIKKEANFSMPAGAVTGYSSGDVVHQVPDGCVAVSAPMAARLVSLAAGNGERVARGQTLAVIEAMKMEHLVTAPQAGVVRLLPVSVGAFVAEGQPLLALEPLSDDEVQLAVVEAPAPEHVRADLQRVIDRHAHGLDANRAAAVAKRHAQGGRTVRENLAQLCDLVRPDAADAQGNFIEYGALAIAAQTRRRSLQDLIANTPADGMVTGIGTVNAAEFGPEASRCVVMAYDYMVLAGTQGMRNHHKKDRMLMLAHQLRLPVVLFAEGGGGRPGDVDMPIVAGLNNHTFSQFAALSGKVPVVGVVHGRCFAGNAALLGCCDAIIATRASNIGMGGPAMIEGGGLGSFAPEAIGPSAVQHGNGVIDVLVEDETEAVCVAQKYLSYFQGRSSQRGHADQRLLRHVVPENRLRVYEVRDVMRLLFDTESVLELRAGFGVGIITALARIDGRPVGVLANNPLHLGGAIDAQGADKAARFMQLCDAHGLPIVSLMDTPGFMVGPDIEEQAQVRHVCRMFVVAAHLRVPFYSVCLRKGYGLGAQAMTAGGFDAPVFNVSWPTGEFGAMGLEGAVRLGFRKELEAAPEGPERDALFKKLVAQQYRNGEAMNMAATLEIDAVIDPADTRQWLIQGLDSAHGLAKGGGSGRFVDAW